MSVFDTILADVQKAEAGAASVITLIEGMWTAVQPAEADAKALLQEVKDKADAVASAVTTPPPAS
jgi:hypothetical protein